MAAQWCAAILHLTTFRTAKHIQTTHRKVYQTRCERARCFPDAEGVEGLRDTVYSSIAAASHGGAAVFFLSPLSSPSLIPHSMRQSSPEWVREMVIKNGHRNVWTLGARGDSYLKTNDDSKIKVRLGTSDEPYAPLCLILQWDRSVLLLRVLLLPKLQINW